jgi:hypothetical protein
MEPTIDDTIGGFNIFIEEQKEFGGTMSLYLFDHEYMPVYEDKNITMVERLTHEMYKPRGSTALLEAIAKTISSQSDTSIEEYQVKIIIMTDGQENASRPEYSSVKIKALIEDKKKLGWDFMFLGADQDVIMQATNLGINPDNVLQFNANDPSNAFRALSVTMSQQARGLGATLSQQQNEVQDPHTLAPAENYGGLRAASSYR